MTGNHQNHGALKYVDFQGHPLLDHDGTMIEIPDHGFQYFDLNGQGFIHDGSPIKLPDGKHLFFLNDGKAVINDGSPIELENGMMQYFDSYGQAMWPVDEKKFAPLYTKQRELFFKERIDAVTKNTPLENSEIEELRLALMACEHPDYLAKENVFDFPPEAKQIKATAISEETEGYLLILKGFWCSVWRDYQLRHKETLSARFVLRQNIEINCLLASYHLSESMLAGELKREFKKAETEIPTPQQYKEFLDIGVTKAGVYVLDDHLIKYFSRFGWGDAAEELVAQLKSMYKSKTVDLSARISSWQQPLFLYRCIANIVWFDIIRPKVKTHYTKAPALPLLVTENIYSIMNKKSEFNSVSGKIIDAGGKELALLEKDQICVPSIDMLTMQRILRPENLKVLSSVNSHRLFGWEVETVTHQVINDKIDARHIFVPGGYQGLTELIGAGTSRAASAQVRDILLWQAALKEFNLIDTESGKREVIREANMISFSYRPSGYKTKSSLEIVVGTMLVPHYLYKLLKNSSFSLSSEAIMLVPMVDSPQLVGRSNEHGVQLSLQKQIVVEFRKSAKELVKNGCVQITKDRFEYLANKVGLSAQILPTMLDAWISGGNDAPAFLKLIEKNHYSFGDFHKHQQAQNFIIQGGKKEIAASEAGKKSVAKRNAAKFSK